MKRTPPAGARRVKSKTTAGIFQPGSDGVASAGFEPSGYRDWRRGAVFTLRRTEAAPRRMLVGVRTRDGAFADLYRRAVRLAAGSRIVTHAWGRHEGAFSFSFATLTAEAGGEGSSLPEPSLEELAAPFGKPPEDARGPTLHFDLIYNDFDFGSPDEVVMFSYGEYVDAAEGLDFAPYIARAEEAARRHHESLDVASDFRVLRREWLFAGDANSMQAVVHVYWRTASKRPARRRT